MNNFNFEFSETVSVYCTPFKFYFKKFKKKFKKKLLLTTITHGMA